MQFASASEVHLQEKDRWAWRVANRTGRRDLPRTETQRPSWNGRADVEAIGARATRAPPSGPALARSPRADGRGQRRSHRMSAERRRLTFALLLSLLIHALLLSLTFGGEGLGLPGFGFPWRERRIEAPDLRVLLLPAQVTTAQPEGASVKEPLLQASTRQPRPGGLVLTPSAAPAPTPGRTATAVTPKSRPTARARPTAEARPEPKAARAAPVTASGAAKVPVTRRPQRSLRRT